jgi:protein-tyrosine phosphatase
MWGRIREWFAPRAPAPVGRAPALHRITERIWQGGYPLPEDFDDMEAVGIRWLFNLDLPYYEAARLEARGFRVVCVLLKDMGKDRPERWWLALKQLARAERELREGCYVHCNAGASRSPTLVWLHLVLGGMDPGAAERLIVAANPHACPGDPAIMDADIVNGVRTLAAAAQTLP